MAQNPNNQKIPLKNPFAGAENEASFKIFEILSGLSNKSKNIVIRSIINALNISPMSLVPPGFNPVNQVQRDTALRAVSPKGNSSKGRSNKQGSYAAWRHTPEMSDLLARRTQMSKDVQSAPPNERDGLILILRTLEDQIRVKRGNAPVHIETEGFLPIHRSDGAPQAKLAEAHRVNPLQSNVNRSTSYYTNNVGAGGGSPPVTTSQPHGKRESLTDEAHGEGTVYYSTNLPAIVHSTSSVQAIPQPKVVEIASSSLKKSSSTTEHIGGVTPSIMQTGTPYVPSTYGSDSSVPKE